MRLISIIIPFYSKADWLVEAIDSALMQTYKNIEVIVINDGSAEDLSEIEKRYGDSVKFYHQENQGAAAARNFGIQKSHGDIVAFLDSDDLWKPNKLEYQIEAMRREKRVWSATAYETFGYGKKKYIKPYSSDKLCWEHLYNYSRIATPTVMVIKEKMQEFEFANDMRKGQDIFLWFCLANKYPLCTIEEPLTLVRVREGFTAHQINFHIQMRAQLWKKLNENRCLRRPKRWMTIAGYKICEWIYAKDKKKVRNNKINKILFGVSWIFFRLDNLLVDSKLKNGKKCPNNQA